MAAKFEIRSPKSGEYSWVLLSQGRTLATGGSYKTKASAEKAVASMRAAVGGATVVDLTLPAARTSAGAAAEETVEKAKNAKTAPKKAKAKKSKGKGKKSGR